MRRELAGLALGFVVVIVAGCKGTNYKVHLLGGQDGAQSTRMAVHVLLLEEDGQKELADLLKGVGLADWFNPPSSEDPRAKLRDNARDNGHLAEITFDTSEGERTLVMPTQGRQGRLWVCILANPSQVVDDYQWQHFHAKAATAPDGCHVYFGLRHHTVRALGDKADRRDWKSGQFSDEKRAREPWEETKEARENIE